MPLLVKQMGAAGKHGGVVNAGGGAGHAISLAHLSDWFGRRFGPHEIGREPGGGLYDVAWLVLNSARAKEIWGWRPQTALADLLEEIAGHAENHPDWLELTEDP